MKRGQQRSRIIAALLAGLLVSPSVAFAHADIIERIEALDTQIALAPTDAALYRKRGELHRLHKDWTSADADYDRAAKLAPSEPSVHFLRGRMWLEADKPETARPMLDRFLAARPDHADALLTRSRVLARLGEHLAAADDLARAANLLDPPTPEVYLDRARALAAAGPVYTDRALASIDEGMARLGPLVTFIAYGVEVERERGDHARALQRLDALPEKIGRQPAWLALRGDILRDLGKAQQAHASYREGLAKIEAYSPARRNARAIAALEARLRDALR